MIQDLDKFYDQIKNEEDVFSKAQLITHLKKEGIQTKDLSAKLGLKPSAVCHLLRLVRLPEIVVDGYYSHLVSISHLFIISRLKTAKEMNQAYEKVLSDNLSVMQTEALIRDMLYHIKSEGSYLSNDERKKYIDQLRSNYNEIDCSIVQTRTKSQITLKMKGSLAQTTPWLVNLLSALKR